MSFLYESQYVQTFALLSSFEFIRHYALSGWHSPVGQSVVNAALRKKLGSKAALSRWFLSMYGDAFGTHTTKQALKYLAGRKVWRRKETSLEKQESFDFFQKPKAKKRKPTNQLEMFGKWEAVNSRRGRIH